MTRSNKIYSLMIAIFIALVILTSILQPENYPELETPFLICGVIPLALLFLWANFEAEKSGGRRKASESKGWAG